MFAGFTHLEHFVSEQYVRSTVSSSSRLATKASDQGLRQEGCAAEQRDNLGAAAWWEVGRVRDGRLEQALKTVAAVGVPFSVTVVLTRELEHAVAWMLVETGGAGGFAGARAEVGRRCGPRRCRCSGTVKTKACIVYLVSLGTAIDAL
jgi:hypothetical protein